MLFNFSLEGKKGEIIGFVGPNGSGKTTVIRMLCGLTKPDSGTGECLGYNIETEGEKIRQRLGYMPQAFSLYNYLTVHENLQFIARLYRVEDSKERIAHIEERLKLTENMNKFARNLSGGWKQRLSLAAAILHEPELLFLDEPTAGVDPGIRHFFWQIIKEIAEQGTTVLVSTHYMAEVERCHKLINLVNGHVLAQGCIADILKTNNIHVWTVTGENTYSLAEKLRGLPSIDLVIENSDCLRIIGSDPVLLFNSLRPWILQHDYNWKAVKPNLEDILLSKIPIIKKDTYE